MRLRDKVTQLRFEGSSNDDDDEAADDAWQPESDADEAPVTEHPAPGAAPRHLTHDDLAEALLRMTATTEAPLCVTPEELTQVRPGPRARCNAVSSQCASGLGARRQLCRPCVGARWRRRCRSARHAAAARPGRRALGC